MPTLESLKSRIKMFLEDEILFRPRPGSKPLPPPDPRIHGSDPWRLLESLQTEGYLSFPGFLSPQWVGRVNALLEEAYAGRRPDLAVRRSKESAIEYIDNPLRLDPEILKLALDPFFLGLIEARFQTDACLADVDLRRVLPVPMSEFERLGPNNAKGYSSSHWHYDIRGRQLKIMVYLTEVREGDQNFAYCPGTHRDHPGVERSRLEIEKSRYPEDWPQRHGAKVLEMYGPAGTLMLFDTNAIHRLRRTGSRQRDSVTFYYTPGQHLRPLDYDPAHLASVPQALQRVLGGRRVHGA